MTILELFFRIVAALVAAKAEDQGLVEDGLDASAFALVVGRSRQDLDGRREAGSRLAAREVDRLLRIDLLVVLGMADDGRQHDRRRAVDGVVDAGDEQFRVGAGGAFLHVLINAFTRVENGSVIKKR